MGFFDRMKPQTARKSEHSTLMAILISHDEPTASQKSEDVFAGSIFGAVQKAQVPTTHVVATSTPGAASYPRPMTSPKMISEEVMSVVKLDGTSTRKAVRVFKGDAGRPSYAALAVGGYLTLTKIERS